MSISIVICTHNRAASLTLTIQSISRVSYNPEHAIDLLVVANACSDTTVPLLEKISREGLPNGLPIRCLTEPQPGKSFALNRAIQETNTQLLFFIDDDQWVQDGFLEALHHAAVTYPNHQIICGWMKPAWDGTEPAWVHETGPYRIPIRPFPEFDLGDVSKDIDPDEKLPSGGNIMVRRSIFSSVGLFYTNIGPTGQSLMGGEDLEFLRRCVASGARIRYVPAIRQLHSIEPSRLTRGYMIQKSYFRSLSNIMISDKSYKHLRLYMLTKPILFAARSLFCFSGDKRFYFMIRAASALGELRGILNKYRSKS